MWRAILILLASAVTLSSAQARTLLGQYSRWGAFREDPARCFAVSEPIGDAPEARRPFVAITRTARAGPPRVHVAPSRPLQPDTPFRLEIGARSFTLSGQGGKDAREDARIIAAMRRAERLRVIGVDTRGRRFHDDYPLAGAPSAIDAAIIGCL